MTKLFPSCIHLSKHIRLLIVPLVWMLITTNSYGQGAITSTWALTSNGNGAATGAGASTITAGTMSPGSEFSSGNYSSNGYECQSTVSWPSSATTSPGYYLDFPISPVSGYDLTLSSFSIIVKTSGSSNPSDVAFAYALDGSSTFTSFSSVLSINSGGTTTVSTTSFTSFTCSSGHTMIVRIYIYAGSGGNSASRNVYIRNFVLNGSTAVAAVTTPSVTSTPTKQTVCNNNANTAISFSGSQVSGTSYNWTNDNTAIGLAASGSGNISFTATNTTSSPLTAHITVTPTANSVNGTSQVDTIIVNPTPTVTSNITSQSVCNGVTTTALTFSGSVTGTSYSWVNNLTAIGLMAGSTGNIAAFTATNTTSGPDTAIVTVTPTANSCTGTPQKDTIIVSPTPTVTTSIAHQSVCNNSNTTAISFSGSSVTNTTYNWTNNITSIGLAASSSGSIASFTASNATTGIDTAIITVTPTANGCSGTAKYDTIIVSPTPTVTLATTSQTVCNGTNTTAINFTGSVPGTTYSWTNNNTAVGLLASGTGNIGTFMATNTGTSPIAAIITVTPIFNGCNGSSIYDTIIVNPTPSVTLSPASQTVCNNASTAAITFTPTVTGTTYAWTSNTTSVGVGASGTTNIASFTATNTGNTPVTAVITVTPTANGCNGVPKYDTIVVNPTPSVTLSPISQTVCNGSMASAITFTPTVTGTTYTWTNNTISVGLGASGTSNIPSFPATNTGVTPTTAIITITPTANNCTGASKYDTIIVNPTPSVGLSPTSQTVCNNTTTTAIVFTPTVTGTTYTWTNNNTAVGLAANGTTSIASFPATNTGTSAITAVITVTPSASGCTGASKNDTIIVSPTPGVSISTPTQSLCSGTYITGINFTGAVNNTSISWTTNNTSIGLAPTGTGNIGSFIATNTGTTPDTATITITPTAGSCTGTTQTATIIVKPIPNVSISQLAQPVCNNGTTIPINFTGNVSGTIYTWTNNTPSINLLASNTGNINSFTAINNGNTPVTATITVIPTANGCTGTSQTATITVNPTPGIALSPTSQTVCNNAATTAITFTPTVTGTTYAWTNNNTSAGLAASGTTNGIGTFTGTNPGNNPVAAIITVTPAANGCTGTSKNDTIIVNPTPSVTLSPTSQTLCNNATTTAVTFTPTVTGTTYAWTNNAPSIGLAASATTNGLATFTATNSGNSPVTAIITVTPTANNCAGAAKYDTIIVNPTPSVTLSPTSQILCNNSTTTTITFNPTVAGTSYAWVNNNTATGLAASGTSNGIGAFPATNSGNSPVTSIITVTPTANNCVGQSKYDTIVVNPTPSVTLSPASQILCTNATTTAITFTPTVSGTGYAWTNNNTSIGLVSSGTTNGIAAFTATNSGNSPVTAVITVTPTANNCIGSSVNDTITVNPAPTVTVTNTTQILCNGTTTQPINFSGPVTNTTYNWTNNNTAINLAGSGSGNINSFTAMNTGNASIAATITVTPMANGCTGTPQTASITVKPSPMVSSSPISQTICNTAGTNPIAFSGTVANTSYNWTNNNTATGLGASGTGNIGSFPAVNTGTLPISSVITVTPTANGCTGNSQSDTITVNPSPTVTASPSVQSVCAGAWTQTITFSSTLSVTTFNWTNNNSAINLASSGSGTIGSFIASNPGTTPVTSVITVSPLSGSCMGVPYTMSITVNPTPNVVVSQTSQSVCNNAPTSAINFSGNVSGTAFGWTNNIPSINLGATGSGNIGSFTAINTTSIPEIATITVTPTANGCTGTSQTATITVEPTPSVTISPATQAVCNGSLTSAIAFTGPVAGTSFAWTNNNTSTGLSASSTGNIAIFTGVNTGNAPATSTITVTPTANGCTGTAQTATLTVNPIPTVTIAPSPQTVCNNTATTTITFSSNVSNASYAWTNTNSLIGLGSLGSASSIPSFTALNSGNTPITATISVTPTANGCTGTTQSQNMTINPTPSVNALTSQTLCNGASSAAITLTGSAVSGTTYNWTNNTTSIGLAASGSTNIPSFTAANTGTTPVVATISATPVANGCYGAVKTATITVNPTPAATASVTNQAVCNGAATTPITFSGTVSNTTYLWTNSTTTAIGLASSGSGNIPQFTAINNGTTPILDTIRITPVANGCLGNIVTSRITINPTPSVISTPVSQSVCNGNITTINFSSPVAGATYTWVNTNTSVGLVGYGSGNISFTSTNAGTAPVVTYISVTPTANGCTGIQQADTITVLPTPIAAIVAAANPLFCPTDSVRISANTGPGFTYQWQFNNTPIPGATADTFLANPAGNYTAMVRNTYNCPTTSNPVTVTHLPAPAALITPAGATVLCQGDSVLLNANVSPGITYTWKLNGIYLSGAHSSSFMAHVTGNYTVYESDGTCNATTPVQSVTVNPLPPAIISTNGPAYICTGGSLVLRTDTGVAAASTYSYQYMLNGALLTGNNQNYTALLPGNYAVTVTTPAGCSNTSSLFPVSVIPIPTATLTPSGVPNICAGDSLVLNANFGTGLTYQWLRNDSTIPGATAISYVAHTAGNYSVNVKAANGCMDTATSINVTVSPGPNAIATATGPTTVCSPATVQLNASTGTGYSYQWQKNDTVISGATTASYAASTTGNYSVKVSNGSCALSSPQVQVAVNTSPVDTMIIYAPHVICTGNTLLMQALVEPGYIYQWQLNGSDISGASSAFYSASVGGSYDVRISTTAGCTVTTTPVAIATAATPTPNITATGNQLCALGYNTYQWYFNGNPIPGATNSCYSPVQDGGYTVAVTNAAGCSGTSPVYSLITAVNVVVAEQVKLYPNPATNIIHIDAPQSVNITINSLDGKQLIYAEDARTIDIGSLPNAIYMVKVFDRNNTLIKIEKLVKTNW